MTEERIAQIEAIIAQCEAQGIGWTNLLVYEQVGGQYQAISRYLKARRARACLAPPTAVEWDLTDDAQEDPQDAPTAVEEPEEDAGPVCSLPALAEPDEPPVPVEQQPPRRVPQLEALQQAVREADATLATLTRERDVQQQTVQLAALALYRARREAQRRAKELRAAVRQATRAPLQRDAQARVTELYAALSVLVGEYDAERIANDHQFAPPWFRS